MKELKSTAGCFNSYHWNLMACLLSRLTPTGPKPWMFPSDSSSVDPCFKGHSW